MRNTTLFMLAMMLNSIASFATTYYVTENATGSGSAWTDAFGDLQSALAVAQAGDEIWVSTGTYYPVACTNCTEAQRQISFDIPSGVAIYGGFAGMETSINQRNVNTNTVILSGNINEDPVTVNNSYSVVLMAGSNAATTLDGITIKDGSANSSTNFGPTDKRISGAGIYMLDNGNPCTPTIRNCRFENNLASEDGGAIYGFGNNGGEVSPALEDCTFLSNTAKLGGAIFIYGDNGGTCDATFNNIAFITNVGNGGGGAIYFSHPFAGTNHSTFNNCSFDYNSAPTSGSAGGAIYNGAQRGVVSPTFEDCTFASPTFLNCIFHTNNAFSGGAVFNNGTLDSSLHGEANPEFTNCLLHNNNVTNNGGAMYNDGIGSESNPIIKNCTFYGNSAGTKGGAIMNNGDSNGDSEPFIRNSIFWENTASILVPSPIFWNEYGSVNIANCLVDASSCADLNRGLGSSVLCLGGMIYNQDPMFMNVSALNFQLDNGSPAINTGNQATIPGIGFDLDGKTRIIGDQVDLGPFENQTALPVELVSFSAKAHTNAVLLSWETASEYNNKGFEIQRSTDGLAFEVIAFEAGQGESDYLMQYNYRDTQITDLPNAVYYRLKQVDHNGQFEYSNIRPVYLTNDNTLAIKGVYPNPATTTTNVIINSPSDTAVQLRLTNAMGKLIQLQEINLLAGIQQIEIDLDEVPNGLFHIQILTPTTSLQQTMIKQ